MSAVGSNFRGILSPTLLYVSLAEALTWIAFGEPIAQDELRSQVEGHRSSNTHSVEERLRKFFSNATDEPPDVPGFGHFEDREQGLEALTTAWRILREEVGRGTIKARGRYTSTYSVTDAHLADVLALTGNVLATYSQFDVTTGGIRRLPDGTPDVLWQDHTRSFAREFMAFGGDERAAGGYLLVEVETAGLMGIYADKQKAIPANRQLNREEIIKKAAAMLADRPNLSIGSAAASIVADLPPNPKSGKPRDKRHIERLIAMLWAEGLSQSPT